MATGYARRGGESVDAFRARISSAWEQYVGPVPQFYAGGRAFGRRVPLPVSAAEEYAAGLNELVAVGYIPPYEEERRPDSWYSGPFRYTVKGQWPKTKSFASLRFRGDGFLALSFLGDRGWTDWARAGSDRGSWDWRWPLNHDAFYSLLTGLLRNHDHYESDVVQMRWTPYPTASPPAEVMHPTAAVKENCAIALLKARFPSKGRALSSIALTAGGGFGREQLWAASGVLKLNMRLLDRLGGVIYETKAGGGWRYKGAKNGKPIPPIDVIDYEGHALPAVPVRPRVTAKELEVVPRVSSYHELLTRYGPGAVVWPAAEGFLVDTGHGAVLHRSKLAYEPIRERAKELGVASPEMMLGPFGVECKAWRAANGFEATPAALAPLWKAANFYPVAYVAGGDVQRGETADINMAYESAPKWGAADLFEHYGFPAAEGQLVVSDPPISVLRETGLVVAVLSLEQCHPWVRHQVPAARGVFTTMRLHTWVAAGAAVIEKLEIAVIAVKQFPSLERPANARWSPTGERWSPLAGEPSYNQTKHWGREAIGRLVPNAENQAECVFVADTSEAHSVIYTLRERGELSSFEFVTRGGASDFEDEVLSILEDRDPPPTEGYWKIRYCPKGLPAGACYHAHAFWLDYAAAVVDREVFRHDWADVVRVFTDSITLAKGATFSEDVVFAKEAPGRWKRVDYSPAAFGEARARPVPDIEGLRAGRYWEPLCGSNPRLSVFEGPPGFGKTRHCLSLLEGHSALVLTPTRRMRAKLAKEEGVKALTWRWALRPFAAFSPEKVRIRGKPILYLPEIGSWPKADVETIIPWLVANGYRLVADGDRFQQPPVEGEEPWEWLDAHATIVPWNGKDWRSKEPYLADLKKEMRGKKNAVALSLLRKAVFPTNYGQFLAEWRPVDLVYVAVHAVRRVMNADLARVHAEKYPTAPKRIVYGSKHQRSGEEEFIPRGAAVPEGAEIAYTTTYSSCQGETAGAIDGEHPKVWLVSRRAGEYFKNAVYVGATRVEHFSQLRIVDGAPSEGDRASCENDDLFEDYDPYEDPNYNAGA